MAQSAEAAKYTNCTSEEEEYLPKECPGYEAKQSDGQASVILDLWGMRSTPLLPSSPGPVWLGMEASDRVLSMGQIKLNYVLLVNSIA